MKIGSIIDIVSDTVVVISAFILSSHHKKKVKQQNRKYHHRKNKREGRVGHYLKSFTFSVFHYKITSTDSIYGTDTDIISCLSQFTFILSKWTWTVFC